jgi:hypothetical protein
MVDQHLIAGILLGGMIPETPLPKFNMAANQFDMPTVVRAGRVASLAIDMYHDMVAALTEDETATTQERRYTMESKEKHRDSTSDAESTSVTGSAGLEIIAAIITAGMLPSLPAPKLHRLAAEVISERDLKSATDIVASALYLYTTILHTVQYAEARMGDRAGDLHRRDN